MKLGKTNEMLQEDVKGLISLFAKTIDKSVIEEVVTHLHNKHGIKESNIYMLFNNSNNVSRLHFEELALFGMQLVVKLGINLNEWKEEWFTEREIKELDRFQFIDTQVTDELEFPLTLEGVSYLGDGFYNATISKQLLARLYKYGKLNYNPNVQRGMKKVRKYGKEFEEPIIFKSKVAEMRKLILNQKLEPSTITLNASQMSSDEVIELEYDEVKKILTINSGSILDIVDGMHRTLATYSAYSHNKDIIGAYPITISNKSDEEIQRYQVNMDKQTPLTRSKITEYKGGYINNVINVLKSTGELKDRISVVGDAKSTVKGSDLITYKMLHDAIKSVYEVHSTFKAREIANEINEYLVYLFGYYGKHIRDNYKVLFDADVFIGHLSLAKKMSEQEILFTKLNEIIELELFDITNEFWINNNVIGSSNPPTKKMKSNIISLFEGLIKGVKI